MPKREDFAAISKVLSQWREEESAIIERIENANKHLEPLPEAIEVIQQYGALVERLRNADRVKHANAISLTVASITIETRTTKPDKAIALVLGGFGALCLSLKYARPLKL